MLQKIDSCRAPAVADEARPSSLENYAKRAASHATKPAYPRGSDQFRPRAAASRTSDSMLPRISPSNVTIECTRVLCPEGSATTGSPGANHAAGNLPRKSAKCRVRPNHVLNRKSHRVDTSPQDAPVRFRDVRAASGPDTNCICEPGLTTLSPSSALIGTLSTFRIPNALRQCKKITLQLKKNILAVIHQVHFVHSGQHVRNSQQRRDVSVAASLRK